MYKSFRIKNFKCFEDLKISGLKRFNLITGLNNTGKTALLEAFFIHAGAQNPGLPLKVLANRGLQTIKIESGRWIEPPWNSYFINYDISKKIILEAIDHQSIKSVLELKIEKGESKDIATIISPEIQTDRTSPDVMDLSEADHILKSTYKRKNIKKDFKLIRDATSFRTELKPSSILFPAYYLSPKIKPPHSYLANLFGNIEKIGKKNLLLNSLKIIEPRLKEISMIVENETPLLQGDIGLKRFLPFELMGDGMVRLATFIIYLSNASDGVVIIDEIETGLHHSILEKFFKVLYKTAVEFNAQVIASTHSFECIKATHNMFSKSRKYDISLIRLERYKNIIRPVKYDRKTLDTSINVGFEVR